MSYCGWASEILHHQFGMVETLLTMGCLPHFTTYQLVQDFCHPPYLQLPGSGGKVPERSGEELPGDDPEREGDSATYQQNCW